MEMRLKFAANLNWLFKEEVSFPLRYKAASLAGFKFVESADPYQWSLDELMAGKKDAEVEHILMNVWPGDTSKGERGIAAIPGRQSAFRESLDTSIKYCQALGCSRLHIMAGMKIGQDEAKMRSVYVENLKYASQLLSQHNIMALIEPINSRLSVPGYYMDTLDHALDVIKEVNHPNLKVQMDLYHMQIMHGNLTDIIQKNLFQIGHMQIAQVPNRHEPDTAGEVNFSYIFDLLEKLDYQGYIGLEYKPAGSTLEGLKWLNTMA